MVTASAKSTNRCDVKVLTDQTTDVPGEVLRFNTKHTRLTLWLLEIRLAYLKSESFDLPTVFVDADMLIFKDLSPWFTKKTAVALLVRTPGEYEGEWPLINSVQWFNPKKRDQLVEFYEEALKRARAMSEDQIRWGAETNAVLSLIEPLEYGFHRRWNQVGVTMIRHSDVLQKFNSHDIAQTELGVCPWPQGAIFDFRWTRKQYMRACYEQTLLKSANELVGA